MANEDSVLKEVDSELAEERQWASIRKYGPSIVGAAIALVAGVAAWQFWDAGKDNAASQAAMEFRNAVELAAENDVDGRAALNAIYEENAEGYGVLAALHRAASFAKSGERLAAITAYREIYNNGSVDKNIKDLARLRAAYLSLADGRDEVMGDLGNLATGETTFVYAAREITGLAALEAGDYETALSLFQQLAVNFSAPQSVRDRADDFASLAASGKAGVNITGEAEIDDLLSAIGESVDGATDVAEDLGGEETHDHVEGEVHEAEETAIENIGAEVLRNNGAGAQLDSEVTNVSPATDGIVEDVVSEIADEVEAAVEGVVAETETVSEDSENE